MDQQQQQVADDLPPGWTAIPLPDGSGRYYFNAITHEISFGRPESRGRRQEVQVKQRLEAQSAENEWLVISFPFFVLVISISKLKDM
jgi:hypothetical protein